MRTMTILATLGLLTGPVMACDYKTDTYKEYGYSSAASTLKDTGLKAGLRGAHVESSKEDVYHPGFMAGEPAQVALPSGQPR